MDGKKPPMFLLPFCFLTVIYQPTMNILGIDPGTARVGWAILAQKNNTWRPLAYGHISTSPVRGVGERLTDIADDLGVIIKKYRPREAAVETLFFAKNVKTAMAVAQARGVILFVLAKENIPACEYTPLQVKQALTGYGKADKRQMQQMVKSALQLKEIPRPDDVADALAIAFCHSNSRKFKKLLSH